VVVRGTKFKLSKETMQIKLRIFTPIRAALRRVRKSASSLIVLAGMSIPTPALVCQQDVHATPMPAASRKQAPDFQLVTADGKTARLSDYRGKVVLLNFWATGCGGCVLEVPSLVEIENANKDAAFTAIGVSMDITYENLKDADEAWTRVRPFIKKYGVNYTIAMGDVETIRAYSLSTLPATFLIDKSGRIAVAYVGVVINKDNVATNIKSLLAEQ
jgi:peroxiredoxin